MVDVVERRLADSNNPRSSLGGATAAAKESRLVSKQNHPCLPLPPPPHSQLFSRGDRILADGLEGGWVEGWRADVLKGWLVEGLGGMKRW